MGRVLTNELIFPNPCTSEAELLVRLHPHDPLECLQFGYLGIDEDLHERIAADEKRMAALGLSYEGLAEAIEQLFVTDNERVNNNLIIRRKYIHSPLCPWGDYTTTSPFSLFPQVSEILVLNQASCPQRVTDFCLEHSGTNISDYPMLVEQDWAMIFSDLHPHLIREHHFLEGLATPYRVEPERARRYLGLP